MGEAPAHLFRRRTFEHLQEDVMKQIFGDMMVQAKRARVCEKGWGVFGVTTL